MLRGLTLAGVASVADAAQWAVIVAGSKDYSNYRHQADACHAQQVVRNRGIPDEHIIHMAYDDIANNRENPFPGKLFNKPDPTGPGKDVYAGCNIDYKGEKNNKENFISVLKGDSKAGGKVLESTAEDTVFIFFSDHGGPGIICFPGFTSLHKQDIQDALQYMSDNKMFKKLVFYLETCESGSIFEGMSIPNVYAVSAANPHESSWGTYCGSDAVVNGKNIGSCLGDLFSVNWMADVEASPHSETLEQNYERVEKQTDKSHVLSWGDKSFVNDTMSEFIGDGGRISSAIAGDARDAASRAVSARSVDLHRFFHMYTDATDTKGRWMAGQILQQELVRQQKVEEVYWKLTQVAFPEDEKNQQYAWSATESPNYRECEMAGLDAVHQHCSDRFDSHSAFALRFHQVTVNICAAIAGGLNLSIRGAVESVCATDQVVI